MLGLLLRLLPTRAAQRVERRGRLAPPDLFSEGKRLADGDVKFRRLVGGIGGRVFDDEAFGFRLPIADCRFSMAQTDRHILQSEVTPDAALKMDHEIALLQI